MVFGFLKNVGKAVSNVAKGFVDAGKAILGIDESSGSDEPHVQSNFSHKNESVVNLLNECLTEISTSIESTTQASNTVGKVNIVATNGSKINIDLSQTANVQAAQTYMSMIDKLMKSDAATDVRLDALNAVAQAVKNDGNFLQSPETAAANIKLENSNTTNATNIQRLNQDLKLAVATCAVNNFEGGNFLADDDSEINFKLNQHANAVSDSLIDMVTNEKSTLSPKVKQEMKSEIEADNKAEGTGIVAGLGHEAGQTVRNISDNVSDTVQKVSEDVSGTFKFGTGMIIAAVAVPVVIIILVIVFVVIYKMMSGNESKGRRSRRRYEDDEDEDDEDYDDNDY